MQYVSSKTVVIKGRFGIFVNRRCWTVDVLRLLSVIQYKKPCKMSMHRSEIYLLLFLFLYVKVFIFWLISLSVLFVSRNELPVFNINQYSFGVWYSSYYIFKVFKKLVLVSDIWLLLIYYLPYNVSVCQMLKAE